MKKILNIHAPINSTSYGYVSCNIIKELSLIGYDLRHIPISHSIPDKHFLPYIEDTLKRFDYDYNAPSLKIWHQHGLNSFCGTGTRIGMPIFELEQFNEVELHSLNNPDKIFVCSNWAKAVIENQVPKQTNNVSVIPLGFDDEIFKPSPMPTIDKTVFANFGKFEVRKGHNVLPDVFNKAFNEDDDVLLIMLPHNFFLNQNETNEWIKLYTGTKLANKIKFFNRQDSQYELYNIMRQVHCGIFPSRAEGWNLEALEMLACGRHLIITDCTGHTEFCNAENSKLINMTSGFEKAFDNKFFDGRFSWRKIGNDEIDQMVEHMRQIHRDRREGKLTLNNSGILTSKNFTWKNTAKIIDQNVTQMI